jgi:hypothetical protein
MIIFEGGSRAVACRETETETETETDRETERQTERQTDRQRDRQTERQRDRQTDRERQRDRQRETERQTDRETERQRDRETETDRQTERQTDRETDRQRDRLTDRQTDRERQRDRQTERQAGRQTDKETDRQRDRQTDLKKLSFAFRNIGNATKMDLFLYLIYISSLSTGCIWTLTVNLVGCKPQTYSYIRYEGSIITTDFEETAGQCVCTLVAGATDCKTVTVCDAVYIGRYRSTAVRTLTALRA